MATKLEIVNAALIKLGQEPIADLAANSKRAKLVDTNYERIKKKILRKHNWNFAKKRVELTADVGSAPEYGFTYQFSLPADFLRLIDIKAGYEEHSIEGDKLLYSGGDTVKILYIHDADESLFDTDPIFTDLLSVGLAHELSYSIVQNQSFKEQLLAEYNLLLGDARSTNAKTRGTPQESGGDGLLDARL